MAWRARNVEAQRYLFIQEHQYGERSLSELCIDFEISRTTAYKWLDRYEREGEPGLIDRSRARHTQESHTSEFLQRRILEVKQKYSSWGPKKILGYLKRHHPNESWPSCTTVGNILSKNGLTCTRKKRKRFPAKDQPLSHCNAPNDIWCVDFKGWFKTKDCIKCDPLTVTDAHSRYILYCSKIHSGKCKDVWRTMEKLFHRYGLPKYLRHDNGPPFATSGVGRLSALSVNLIKAGVTPEWIDPGKPYQNGRHERMHLTLKQEATFPLKLSLREQQMKFREFIEYFNNERPHEAIDQKVPSDVYLHSERDWDGQLRSPEYGPEYVIKRVRKHGQVGWRAGDFFIGKALAHEYIGFKENNNEEWQVYYGPILLGRMSHSGQFEIPKLRPRSRRNYKKRCY